MSRSSALEGLLAEVKADAAAEAEAEAARIAAARVAREAEEARRRAEAQARIDAEIRVRLEAEARRRALVAVSRQPVTPRDLLPVELPVALKSEAVPVRLAPPLRRGTGFWFAAVSLPIACAAAVALVWILGDRPDPTFRPPPPAALPEVAGSPEPVAALPEVMPVALARAEVEAGPTAVPAVEAPRAPVVRRRAPRVRVEAPRSEGLRLDNLLETDDTRPRR